MPSKRGKGRPKMLDPRNGRLIVRLNCRELSMLSFICEHYGINKSEFIRMAIETYFNTSIREEACNGGATE